MPHTTDKSSLTQFFLLLTLALYTPAMGLTAGIFSGDTSRNVWVSPLLGGIIAIPTVFCIWYLRRKYPGKCFFSLLTDLCGKWIGRILLILLILLCMLLAVLYLRFFSEQMGAAMFAYTQNTPVIILSLVCALFLFFGLRPMARMSQLIFPILLLQFGVLVVMLYTHFSVDRLTPIAADQLPDIFRSSLGGGAVLAFLCTLLFMNERTAAGKKEGRSFWLFLVLVTAGMFVLALGLTGFYGNEILSLFYSPPITAVSEVFSADPLTGLTAFFVFAWILSDMMGLFLLCYISLHLIRQFAGVDDTRFLIPVFTFSLLFAALLISNNPYDVSLLISHIALPGILLLFGALPILLAILRKIRGKQNRRFSHASTEFYENGGKTPDGAAEASPSAQDADSVQIAGGQDPDRPSGRPHDADLPGDAAN